MVMQNLIKSYSDAEMLAECRRRGLIRDYGSEVLLDRVDLGVHTFDLQDMVGFRLDHVNNIMGFFLKEAGMISYSLVEEEGKKVRIRNGISVVVPETKKAANEYVDDFVKALQKSA